MAITLTRARVHPSPVEERPPEPEVGEKAKRRSFTAEYKLRVLEEVDHAVGHGEIGALLRREGLYSSHLVAWRRQRDEGRLDGRARGRKGKDRKDVEIGQLRRENSRLRRRLEQAQTVIEVQKKLSQALGIERETSEDDERP